MSEHSQAGIKMNCDKPCLWKKWPVNPREVDFIYNGRKNIKDPKLKATDPGVSMIVFFVVVFFY